MTERPARITAPFLDVLEAFVASGGEELHGYAIIKASGRGGPTVYKILERLDAMGMVTTRWDDRSAEPNKPRRRYYKLNGAGVSLARELLAERRPQPARRNSRPAMGGAW